MTAPTLRLGRRATLQLLGLGAASLALRPWPAAAAGLDGTLDWMGDGWLELTNGFVFPEAPAEVLQAEVGSSDPNAPFKLPCTVPLLKTGERVILFDAGSGPGFMPTAGKLIEALTAAGTDPADVTDIIFTHGHPDHLWGVTDDFDELAFPNAAYHMAAVEHDFWMAPDAVGKMPAERQNFVAGAQSRLPRLAEKATFFADGAEVLPGIESVPTHGHSPGHTSYVLHFDGDPLMLTGDVFAHPLTVAHPGWRWGTDQDPEAATAQRLRMIDRLSADKMRAAVFHMNAPGIGRVEKTADGGLWVPDAG